MYEILCDEEAAAMSEALKERISMDVGQARALVDYVEDAHNPVGIDLLTWARYYQAIIALLQSPLPDVEKIRYTHLHKHPRALNAIELQQYIVREVDYMRERLGYVEKKLQQLWQTAGLSEAQARIVREGLGLSFTYRELTEMWEHGV
jgi:hypothetical protein